MMLALLLRLALSDAMALGHDSWDVRQAAEGRLSRMGVLSVPAAAMAALGGNADARHRAARLLSPRSLRAFDGVRAWDEMRFRLLALWLFYGPDEWEPRDYRRFLRTEGPTARWAARLPLKDMLRLVGIARRWGLLADFSITLPELMARNANGERFGMAGFRLRTDPGYWCWINVVRWRAVGNNRLG